LAVAALSTVPVNAQSFPRYSTPEEHAQTETLNADQASTPGIIVVPDAAADANYQAALAQHDANVAQQKSQYDAQIQDYQQKNNQYTEQSKDYRARVDNYAKQYNTYEDQAADYAASPPVVVVNDPPDVVVVDPPVVEERHVLVYPDLSSLVHLDDLGNPDQEIAGIAVEDRFGNVVGHFRHMTFQDQGTEKAVITLHNNKSVAVLEDHLRFDPDHSVVVADLSFDDLNRMPARF